ncbi:uncharacterized protein LOC131994109 [Stomoxys calcitrans]|uniref:uncharacterized protein LOC131994109 n=1 Tax=Stomoxys calcitrans TaxID=35570 RepID=UPI0027E3A2AB|nr:uncharacterized protein LOC131994109 [Stomoxys calcitrans]
MESNIDQKSGAFSPNSEGTSTNGVSNLQNSNFVNCEHELNAKALRDDETISYKYQRPLSPSPNPDKSSPKEDLGRQHHSNLVNYDEFKLDLERSHRDFGTRPSSRKTKNYDRNMLAGRPKLDNNPKQESQFIENKTKKLFEGHSTGLNSYEDMLNLGPVGINDSISNRYLSKLHDQFSRAICKELKQNPKFKNVFSSKELRKAENFNKQPVPEELELQSQNMKDTMNSSGFKEEMVPSPSALKTRSSQKPMNSREGLISANLSLTTLKNPQYLPLAMNPKSNVDLRKTQSLTYEKFHLTTDKNFKKPKDYGTSKNAPQSLEQLEQNICKSKNINKAEIMEKFKSLTSSILQEKDVDTSQYSENEVQKDEQNGTNYTESSVTRQATPAGTFENPTSRQSTTNAYNDDCTKNNKELLQMTEAQIESSRYLLAASENFQTLSDRRIDYNTLHLEKRLQTFSTYPNRIHEALQSLRDLSLNLYNIEPLERHELEEFACEIVKKFSTDRCVERKPSENNPRHTTIEMPTTMTPYKQEKEEVISQNQPNSFGEDHHLETKQIEHAERLQENIQFIPNESSIKESLSNSEFEKNAYLEPSLTNLEGCLYFSPISTTEENNEKTQNLYANGEDNRSNTNINTEQSLRRLESLTGSCPNIPLKGMLNPVKNIRSCANFGIRNMPTSELVCCSETNLSPVKDQELKEEHIANEDCVNIYETHTEAYHTENDCIGRGPNNRYFFIPRPGSMSNPPAFSHCPCMFKTYLNILETF